jgi:hypothetical protein
MPEYTFQHPKLKKVISVFLGMKEEKEYIDNKGVKWIRIWHIPNATIDAAIDPFSENQFISKVGNTKGSIGDVWDRSAELSDKRASKRDGIDPVKKKKYDDFKKKNRKPHINQVIEQRNAAMNKTHII